MSNVIWDPILRKYRKKEAQAGEAHNRQHNIFSPEDHTADGGEEVPAPEETNRLPLIVNNVLKWVSWAKIKALDYAYWVLGYPGKDIKFGLLYNFAAVTDPRNITPAGWHIPTKNEWKVLWLLEPNSAYKCMEVSLEFWNSIANLTNSAKLNLRGAGAVYSYTNNPQVSSFKTQGLYMTSEAYSPGSSAINTVYASPGTSYIAMYGTYKRVYGSVRAVRDSTTLLNGQEGTYTGNNGRTYKTICIGAQEWLAENLAETKYRDGSDIQFGYTNTDDDTSPRYCYPNNDINEVFLLTPKLANITSKKKVSLINSDSAKFNVSDTAIETQISVTTHLQNHHIDSIADHHPVQPINKNKLVGTDPVTGAITFFPRPSEHARQHEIVDNNDHYATESDSLIGTNANGELEYVPKSSIGGGGGSSIKKIYRGSGIYKEQDMGRFMVRLSQCMSTGWLGYGFFELFSYDWSESFSIKCRNEDLEGLVADNCTFNDGVRFSWRFYTEHETGTYNPIVHAYNFAFNFFSFYTYTKNKLASVRIPYSTDLAFLNTVYLGILDEFAITNPSLGEPIAECFRARSSRDTKTKLLSTTKSLGTSFYRVAGLGSGNVLQFSSIDENGTINIHDKSESTFFHLHDSIILSLFYDENSKTWGFYAENKYKAPLRMLQLDRSFMRVYQFVQYSDSGLKRYTFLLIPLTHDRFNIPIYKNWDLDNIDARVVVLFKKQNISERVQEIEFPNIIGKNMQVISLNHFSFLKKYSLASKKDSLDFSFHLFNRDSLTFSPSLGNFQLLLKQPGTDLQIVYKKKI